MFRIEDSEILSGDEIIFKNVGYIQTYVWVYGKY